MLRAVRETSTAPSTRWSWITGSATKTRSEPPRLKDWRGGGSGLEGMRRRRLDTAAPVNAVATSSCAARDKPSSSRVVETTTPFASSIRMPASVVRWASRSTG
jgi:hypothetical protein